MLLAILGVTLRGLLFTITGSCFVAEFSGYWLHRLLHSDTLPAFSRGPLIHRFLTCRPNQPLLGFDQEELFSLRSRSQALFHKNDSGMKA